MTTNMKKKTKLQPVAEGAAEGVRARRTGPVKGKTQQPVAESAAEGVRAHRTGPIKEKVQITIRIDQQLMNEVLAQIKDDNQRITDYIERGLQLALGEARHDMPLWTRQTRFVLANMTRQQEKLIRGLAIAMVEQEVVKLHPTDQAVYDLLCWYLEARNNLAHGVKCLELYSRYGKSAEEIAKLG